MESNSSQYVAITPLGERCVQLNFSGNFNNAEVLWHAELCSLSYIVEHYANTCPQARQFLDVQITGTRHEIRVGLAIDFIGHADVLKAIIMIRQYKLLKTGIHWFGGNVA